MITEKQTLLDVQPGDLVMHVLKCKHEHDRLVQMCATREAEGFELSYSFAREYEFLTLRMHIGFETEIVSISNIYYPAFLYENEMKELFGIHINHIELDYEGQLYRMTVKTPYNPAPDGKEV